MYIPDQEYFPEGWEVWRNEDRYMSRSKLSYKGVAIVSVSDAVDYRREIGDGTKTSWHCSEEYRPRVEAVIQEACDKRRREGDLLDREMEEMAAADRETWRRKADEALAWMEVK